MPLVKQVFQQQLYDGFLKVLTNRAGATDEKEDPQAAIMKICEDLAKVVSDSVDAYIKTGDIVVGATEVGVISGEPGSAATVASLKPAKII